MKEFELIRQRLAHLSRHDGALQLGDDVSTLPKSEKIQIITTDTLVEGVHFLSDDPMYTVGQKLVRVNVSDCLAKAARPTSAMFNLSWPSNRPETDLTNLIDGLAADLEFWNIDLIGGDTTGSQSGVTLTLTLIGDCQKSAPVRRSGAQVEDDVWITGEIGSAFLGLRRRLSGVTPNSSDPLVSAFLVPPLQPVAVSSLIADFAHASMDVSDGLIADAEHLAEQSGVSLQIELDRVPLHAAANKDLRAGLVEKVSLLTGGDDYQVLFTASPTDQELIRKAAAARDVSVTCIGSVQAGSGVKVRDSEGNPITILTSGWQHEF
ncbi:MAG: thiamine-phosphate kinase [Ponticaulis sp.]|nr:thiamine-phosphate kinase [Ponticaulis sp.]